MPVQLDLHPDDLLDRARRRLISADERLYLDSHLRECATCRFILEAGRAFDAEAAACKAVSLGPLIDRAMHRPHAGGGRAARPPARRLAAGIMTAVATLGGVAFAGYWGHRHPLVEATPVVVATTVAPTPVPRRAARPAPVIAEPAASPPPARTEPVRPSPPPPRRPPAVRQEVAIAAPAPVETPATLFTAANRARRLGQTEAAERAYQQLWTRFRASPEARASRAIGGRWMLDRGRPSEAIARFSDYLAVAPAGELEEDVLVGLADAQEQAGARAPAAATWRRLLAEHPGSVHADRARDGLRRLQAGTSP